jgi:hypothetical protein
VDGAVPVDDVDGVAPAGHAVDIRIDFLRRAARSPDKDQQDEFQQVS